MGAGGEERRGREIREMSAADRALSGRADCSAMGDQIAEEAGSSAHRAAGAGISPASHNKPLPWRQKKHLRARSHTHLHTQAHTSRGYMQPATRIRAAGGNASLMQMITTSLTSFDGNISQNTVVLRQLVLLESADYFTANCCL